MGASVPSVQRPMPKLTKQALTSKNIIQQKTDDSGKGLQAEAAAASAFKNSSVKANTSLDSKIFKTNFKEVFRTNQFGNDSGW